MRKLSLLAAILLASCASITRGVDNDVSIQYAPADADVTTSLNHRCNASPCTVNVARKKSFQVIAKREGFETEIVDVRTRVSGAGAAGFAGNMVAGGVIGMGVDAATGATLEHYPNPVIIKMKPLDGSVDPAQPDVPAAATETPEVVPTS